MSIFTKVATVSDYPRGLMNLCQCGQVILAPATIHDICTPQGDAYRGTCMHDVCISNRKVI